MKLFSAVVAIALFLPVVQAQTPTPASALPNHIVMVGASYNQNNTPSGLALFGVGQKVSDTDYLTNLTEFTPSSKGTMTANRTGLHHIVYGADSMNFYAFLSADGGVATSGQSVSGSWSGGGGVAQRITAIKTHNVWIVGHARVVDSAIAADRKAVVVSIGFLFGGN